MNESLKETMDSWYDALSRSAEGHRLVAVTNHQFTGVTDDVYAANEQRASESTELFYATIYDKNPSKVAISPGDLWTAKYVPSH